MLHSYICLFLDFLMHYICLPVHVLAPHLLELCNKTGSEILNKIKLAGNSGKAPSPATQQPSPATVPGRHFPGETMALFQIRRNALSLLQKHLRGMPGSYWKRPRLKRAFRRAHKSCKNAYERHKPSENPSN